MASAQDLGPGDAARGAGLYARACAYCHGAARTGAGRVGGAVVLPDETEREHNAAMDLDVRGTSSDQRP